MGSPFSRRRSTLSSFTLSFDLDHTLMINPFRRWVFPEIEAWYRRHVPEETPSLREALRREHRLRLHQGRMRDAYDWDDILRTVAMETAGILPPFTVRELVEKHAVPGKVWRFADVSPALETLRRSGARLVVATNGFECYQRPVTDCLGLTPYFSAFHTPDRLFTAKPCPDFFRFAEPDHLIHVGDRIDQDIAGANRAGAVSVWICRDLPPDVWKLPVSARTKHPDFPRWIAGRLKKEGHPGPVAEELLPDYVIVSLEELTEVWEKEK